MKKTFFSWLRISLARPVHPFLGQILTLLGYLEINLDIFWSDSKLTEPTRRYLSHLSGENLGLQMKLEMNLDLFLPGSDTSFKLT